MDHRILEVTAEGGYADTIQAIAKTAEAPLTQVAAPSETEPGLWRILAGSETRQSILDSLQQTLNTARNWRIVILPVEAVIPRPEPTQEPAEAAPETETREELYDDIAKGAEGRANFYLLAVLSTIVAAIGLLTDNVAVVIGAMVIAPLLGPNLAFAFGTILGDKALLVAATRTNIAGIAVTLALSIALGAAWPNPLDSAELLSRTEVGYDSIAIALASGFAAALSMTTGLSSALVGVMVAVALLPPAATLGIMVGAGELNSAVGAALLLAVNIICVNLSAQIAFIVRGLGPRTWWEKRRAKSWARLNLIILIVFLAVLAGLIYLRRIHFM